MGVGREGMVSRAGSQVVPLDPQIEKENNRFPCSEQPRTPGYETAPSTIKVGLPTSINLTKLDLHRFAQKLTKCRQSLTGMPRSKYRQSFKGGGFSSPVSLDPIKLSVLATTLLFPHFMYEFSSLETISLTVTKIFIFSILH